MRKHQASPGVSIMDKKSRGCFVSPRLDFNKLDNSVVERLLTYDADMETLRKEFVLIANQDRFKDSEIDDGVRKNLMKTVAFKTPSKSKFISSKLGETVTDLITTLGTDTGSGDLKSKGESELSEPITNLVDQYAKIKLVLPAMANVINTLEVQSKDREELIYGNIQQVQQLQGTIGGQSTVLKDANMEPTVWGSLTELFLMLQKSDAKDDFSVATINAELNNINQKLSNLPNSNVAVNGLKSEVFQLLQGWKTIIENLATRVTTIENMPQSTTGITSSSNNPFSTLGISGTPNLGNTNVTPSIPVPSDINELLTSINSRLGKMKKQQTDHGKDGLKGAVRFGGVTFTNKDDVGAWIDAGMETVGGIPPYGLFADPQLLLHWIWILLSGSTNSSARDMKDRISIEMTQDKTYAIDSYQHYIPLVFTGKKTSLLNTGGMEKSRLAQIPTFESWDDATGETGLKQQISEGLTLVKSSICDLIQETFENSPEIRAFALVLLHTSSSFIENLGTYMSETFNNFKEVVGNKKSVWGLVTFVVEQLFRKDFGQVRAKTIGAIDANNRTSGIKIIWSSIKCVDVAQQFMSHGIKNAPAVSASYVRFVITHSNMGKVTNLMEENKLLKRKLNDIETDLNIVKKMAESAKKIADTAMSKVTNPPKKKKKKTDSEPATEA
jgi:hypothetical protein